MGHPVTKFKDTVYFHVATSNATGAIRNLSIDFSNVGVKSSQREILNEEFH